MPRLGRAFHGINLALTFLAWYLLADVGLVLLLDRGLHAEWMAYPWFLLHFAVNPVVACIVAAITVGHAVRGRRGRELAAALCLAPVLLVIAYLGFTRDFRLLAWLGLSMRGI